MRFNCAYKEVVDIHRLQANPKNPNSHPEKQIKMLSKIIDYQGQRSPVVVSKRSGFIVKGHGRLEAIKSLGWTQVAVDYQDYDSEAQEYADMVADNKIAELAEHDDAMMVNDILELEIDDFELLGLDNFSVDIAEADMPELSDAERGALRQMAFQLTEDQIDEVERAIKKAKEMGDFGDTGSSNSNGNALQRIAEIFNTTQGG